MSIETFYMSEEIRRIHETVNTLRQSAEALRNFVLSPKFLTDYVTFETLLGKLQDNIVGYVQAINVLPTALLEQFMKQGQAPLQPQPQPTLETPSALETFTLPRALVSIVAIIGCGIAVEQRLLPPIALLGVIGACVGLAFAPQLSIWVNALLQPKKKAEEEELPSLEKVEDWLYTEIDIMRRKYRSARFLLKWQPQKLEHFPELKELGYDRATVDREQYLNESLPHEFCSRIEKIVEACNKNADARINFIISSMVQARQGMMTRQ